MYQMFHNSLMWVRVVGFGIAGLLMMIGSRAEAVYEPELNVGHILEARQEMDTERRISRGEEALDRINSGTATERDYDRARDYLDRDWR